MNNYSLHAMKRAEQRTQDRQTSLLVGLLVLVIVGGLAVKYVLIGPA